MFSHLNTSAKKQRILANVCQEGVDQGVFRAVSAAIYDAQNGLTLHAGGQSKNPTTGILEPVTPSTIFDLASLTKALCTALCIAALISQKKLSYNTTLESIWGAQVPEDKKQITITELLSHSSGLPAYIPFFAQFPPCPLGAEKRELLLDSILHVPLHYPRGSTCLYSDLGFLLLGMLLEKITGDRLDTLFFHLIAKNFSSFSTPECQLLFLPIEQAKGELAHFTQKKEQIFAVTEYCLWRKKILHKQVHDEHSWLMNGVAGHAGLFGTAQGVAELCQAMLQYTSDEPEKSPLAATINPGVMRHFWTPPYRDQTWCLGFDRPSTGASSSGTQFSPTSVGHLGFTGTSFWIDWEKELVMVLLTNRVYPARSNKKIQQFRPFFHDTLRKACNL